jgi:Asp-tRNA(Asn)/Glu-tRNA(Gln) amidotransferase B subunit
VSETNPLMEVAVARISKRLNIPPDQVRAIIKPLFEKKDVVKEYEELAKRLDALRDLFAKLPEEARSHVLTHIIRSEIAKSSGSASAHVSDVAIVRDLLRGMGEDPEVKSLRDEVRALRDLVSKLLEDQAKRSAAEEFKKEVEALRSELNELRKLIEARPQQQQSTPEDVKKLIEDKLKSIEDRIARLEQSQQQSFKTVIGQALKELKETIELAKEYGLIREAAPAQGQAQPLDPEKLAEELKKYGYEVRRNTLTREEVEKLIDEVRRRAYEEAMREAGIEKDRMQQVGEIIRTIIREIGGPIVKTITEAQREYMREALRARLRQQQQLAQLAQQQAQQQLVQQPVQISQQAQSQPQARSGGERGGVISSAEGERQRGGEESGKRG